MRAWDLGGHEAVRELWRDYYLQADAILFMVDSADVERFGEARDELAALMDDPALRAVPVAVLANKKDLPVGGHRPQDRGDAAGIPSPRGAAASAWACPCGRAGVGRHGGPRPGARPATLSWHRVAAAICDLWHVGG